MALLAIGTPSVAWAADDLTSQQTASPEASPTAETDDDAAINPAEPDFTLISLPTSLRLPTFKSAFRVTHRFARPLTGDGNFGSLAADLFGLDSGAQIGLEYRFGIVPNGELGIHRTSDRTIEFFSQYGIVRQRPKRPVDVTALASIDGTNNFRDQYTPALGAIVSRRFAERAALYVEPTWVHHANVQPSSADEASDTVMVGLGGRLRVRPTVSVTAEFSPRVSGYTPGVSHAGVAIEKRAGGHVFQLNVSDSFATTMGQIARGGPASKDWFLGFNISRKFF
jgi:uncharacterized beta barrel domain-containing protein DUF5777